MDASYAADLGALTSPFTLDTRTTDALASFEQGGKCGARHHHGTGQVDGDRVVPAVVIDVAHRAAVVDPGVGHDDVEAAERAHGLGDGLVRVPGVSGVARHGPSADLRRERFERLGPPPGDDHPAANGSEPARDRGADAGPATADQRHPVGQPHRVTPRSGRHPVSAPYAGSPTGSGDAVVGRRR